MMTHHIDPIQYEKALAEKFRYDFRPPHFNVVHNMKVQGKYSRGMRQIDIAVQRVGDDFPILVVEAKRRGRKVAIEYIDAFITKLLDVDAKIGVMVASSNFSEPGRRLAAAFGVELSVISVDDALEMSWRPVARQIFPMDWAFHPDMAAGLYQLQKGDPAPDVIEAIEEIPFDEWEKFVEYALAHHPSEAADFLWFIAKHHYDDSWRFNAIQQLLDSGLFDQFDTNRLLARERDPDITTLLKDYGYL